VYPLDIRDIAAIHDRGVFLREELERLTGDQVRLFCYRREESEFTDEQITAVRGKFTVRGLRGFTDASALCKEVARWRPDVVLLRGVPFFWPFARLCRSFPTVLEIHDRDTEYADTLGPVYGVLQRMFRHAILSRCKGALFVTRELRDFPGYQTITGPRIVVTNGVYVPEDIDEPVVGPRPVIGLSVGLPNPWQGVDYCQRLAALLPDVDFHVVSSRVRRDEAWPENMTVVTPGSSTDYRTALSLCTVCLGSLALERAGLTESTALKVRDYAALGVPIALFSTDTDLSACGDPMVRTITPPVRGIEATARELRAFVSEAQGRRLAPGTRRLVDRSEKAKLVANLIMKVTTQ